MHTQLQHEPNLNSGVLPCYASISQSACLSCSCATFKLACQSTAARRQLEARHGGPADRKQNYTVGRPYAMLATGCMLCFGCRRWPVELAFPVTWWQLLHIAQYCTAWRHQCVAAGDQNSSADEICCISNCFHNLKGATDFGLHSG